ncbi:gamma-glutamyltransferase [Hyalangium versicolor]|uniref:gamma-glutamyltransferase n=1 Tax=Hyalangium versicolor TaxID=2861190 RepID=UPI001CCFF212|nr:gamma-glutamyltransferase [Hyalangium versicolor]
MRRLFIAVCTGSLLAFACAHDKAASSPASSSPVPTPPLTPQATGQGGAASTVDVRATAAAIEILKGGGNAVDAAVAAAGVLGVTDPYSCGIGGGGFMLIYLADEKRVVAIDHRETAPRAMSREFFYEGGAPIPMMEVLTSGLSAGVPGMVRGWEVALQRYGTRGLSEVLQPGIRVAERGFEVDQFFVDQTTRNVDRFKLFSSTARVYLPGGKPTPVGGIFTNPDMAKTYRLVAEGGSRAFYQGEIARAIVDTLTNPPMAPDASRKVRLGVMQLADLEDYEARVREPVKTTYRGYTVYGVGAPTSGGLAVSLALNLLEGYEPASMSRVDFLHRYLESSRLAFADRTAYVGDPEYVDVPVDGLLSKAYAIERRKAIDPARAAPREVPAGNPFAFQVDPSPAPRMAATVPAVMGSAALAAAELDTPDRETTHIVTSDKAGNVVSYTCTIEFEGGDGIVVPGYGFLLNNELTDFDVPKSPTAPHANIPEPGKRPRSSISPTLVFKDGAPVLALGSPGGSTIITTVLQTLVNHLDFGMPLLEAVAAPRVSQRNSADGASQAEPEFLASPEAAALKEKGHVFGNAGPVAGMNAIGAVTAIRFNPDGTVTVVAEPKRRGGGSAMVVEGAAK